MKNSKVKAMSRKSHTADLFDPDEDQYAAARRLDRAAKRVSRFSKIPDVVAESDHWMRNEPIPHGLDLFPGEMWFMRYADLFYPNAKGGPLYMDTPGNPTDIMYCERKLEAYRGKKIRYTYLKSGEDAEDVLMRLHQDLPTGLKIAEPEPEIDQGATA